MPKITKVETINRPMSEKPRPHENVGITFQDDDQILFDYVRTAIIDNEIWINTSLECFGDGMSWDKYVERNTSPEDGFKPIGWRYLNEKVKVVWVERNNHWYKAEVGVFGINVLYSPTSKEWVWDVNYGAQEEFIIVRGKALTLKAAQSAAIEWCNKNLAPFPELES